MQNKAPKKWKMMLLIWLCIYPLISVISFTLMPHIMDWHPLLRNLLVTIILVPIMGAMLSMLQKKFNNWLQK